MCCISTSLFMLYIFYYVTLNSVIMSKLIILKYDIAQFFPSLYVINLIFIYQYLQMTIVIIINFLKREMIFLFLCSLGS